MTECSFVSMCKVMDESLRKFHKWLLDNGFDAQQLSAHDYMAHQVTIKRPDGRLFRVDAELFEDAINIGHGHLVEELRVNTEKVLDISSLRG